MKENDFRRLLQKKMPDIHWQSIESRMTARGIPDLNGCLAGIEIWAELKRLTGTRKLRFMRPLTPTQALWLTKRSQAGGRCFVIARHDIDASIRIWPGRVAEKLRKAGPAEVLASRHFMKDHPHLWAAMQAWLFS